jgi:hypothetical protein
MKLLAAILSWVGMLAACVLLSRGLIHYGFPLAVVACLLRMLPPRERLHRISSYGFFIGLLPLWGVFVTAPREHWSSTTIMLTRVVALLFMLLTAGWCLFRDWRRFKISDETAHVV